LQLSQKQNSKKQTREFKILFSKSIHKNNIELHNEKVTTDRYDSLLGLFFKCCFSDKSKTLRQLPAREERLYIAQVFLYKVFLHRRLGTNWFARKATTHFSFL